MIKLKIKYNDGSNKNEPTNSVNHLDNVYGDLHKLDEKIQEIHKLVDNNKDQWYNIGTQQGVTYVR